MLTARQQSVFLATGQTHHWLNSRVCTPNRHCHASFRPRARVGLSQMAAPLRRACPRVCAAVTRVQCTVLSCAPPGPRACRSQASKIDWACIGRQGGGGSGRRREWGGAVSRMGGARRGMPLARPAPPTHSFIGWSLTSVAQQRRAREASRNDAQGAPGTAPPFIRWMVSHERRAMTQRRNASSHDREPPIGWATRERNGAWDARGSNTGDAEESSGAPFAPVE